MNLNFKPQVKYEIGKDIILTATRPVTSRVWDIMRTLNDQGIFEQYRPNKIATQLQFIANPGFHNDQVYSILLTAIYIAQKMESENFETFWEKRFEDHLEEIKDCTHVTIIKVDQTKNPPQSSDVFDNTIALLSIRTWIFSKAYIQAFSAQQDVCISEKLNPNFTFDRLEMAQTTLTRLRFLDPEKTFVNKNEINGYITAIEGKIQLLKNDHLGVFSVNYDIERIKNYVRNEYAALKSKIEEAEENDDFTNMRTIFILWKKFMDLCVASVSEIKSLKVKFKWEISDSDMEYIRQITPPREAINKIIPIIQRSSNAHPNRT